MYRIYNDDCINKLPAFTGITDFIFADPPYNISKSSSTLHMREGTYQTVHENYDLFTPTQFRTFTNQWLQGCYCALKPNGVIAVCCSYHNVNDFVSIMCDVGFDKRYLLNIVIWHKTNPIPNLQCRQFRASYELIILWAKGPRWVYNYKELKKLNGDKQPGDVIKLPICGGKERITKNGKVVCSTQKPVKLVEWFLRGFTLPDSFIVDPFLGVGTTITAAKNTNRVEVVGIEINYETAKYARERCKVEIEGQISCSSNTIVWKKLSVTEHIGTFIPIGSDTTRRSK